jgi:hypothetical protein
LESDSFITVLKKFEENSFFITDNDGKFKIFENKTYTISKEIHHIDNTITIVKNQTNEKANNAGKFSNVELEQLFANRYN